MSRKRVPTSLTPRKCLRCRRCKTCVVDLDHHCLFLNNCVGINNLRHFILLLVFLILGCCYTLGLCSISFWQHRQTVAEHWRRWGICP